MTEPVSRTGLTMNPKTSMVLLLVGRLVSIVTAGSPTSGVTTSETSAAAAPPGHVSPPVASDPRSDRGGADSPEDLDSGAQGIHLLLRPPDLLAPSLPPALPPHALPSITPPPPPPWEQAWGSGDYLETLSFMVPDVEELALATPLPNQPYDPDWMTYDTAFPSRPTLPLSSHTPISPSLSTPRMPPHTRPTRPDVFPTWDDDYDLEDLLPLEPTELLLPDMNSLEYYTNLLARDRDQDKDRGHGRGQAHDLDQDVDHDHLGKTDPPLSISPTSTQIQLVSLSLISSPPLEHPAGGATPLLTIPPPSTKTTPPSPSSPPRDRPPVSPPSNTTGRVAPPPPLAPPTRPHRPDKPPLVVRKPEKIPTTTSTQITAISLTRAPPVTTPRAAQTPTTRQYLCNVTKPEMYLVRVVSSKGSSPGFTSVRDLLRREFNRSVELQFLRTPSSFAFRAVSGSLIFTAFAVINALRRSAGSPGAVPTVSPLFVTPDLRYQVHSVLQFVPAHMDVRVCNFSERVERGLMAAYAETRRRSHETGNVTIQLLNITMGVARLPSQQRAGVEITFAVRDGRGYLLGSEVSDRLRKLSLVEFSFFVGFPALQIAEPFHYPELNTSHHLRYTWVRTVLLDVQEQQLSERSFKARLERRLALLLEEGLQASSRGRWRRATVVGNNSFVGNNSLHGSSKGRWRRATAVGNNSLQVVRVARQAGPQSPLEVFYFVEGPNGERVPAEVTAATLNNLDLQRAAIVLGHRVQRPLAQPVETLSVPPAEQQSSNVWLVVGVVVPVLLAVFIIIIIYWKLCSSEKLEFQPDAINTIQQRQKLQAPSVKGFDFAKLHLGQHSKDDIRVIQEAGPLPPPTKEATPSDGGDLNTPKSKVSSSKVARSSRRRGRLSPSDGDSLASDQSSGRESAEESTRPVATPIEGKQHRKTSRPGRTKAGSSSPLPLNTLVACDQNLQSSGEFSYFPPGGAPDELLSSSSIFDHVDRLSRGSSDGTRRPANKVQLIAMQPRPSPAHPTPAHPSPPQPSPTLSERVNTEVALRHKSEMEHQRNKLRQRAKRRGQCEFPSMDDIMDAFGDGPVQGEVAQRLYSSAHDHMDCILQAEAASPATPTSKRGRRSPRGRQAQPGPGSLPDTDRDRLLTDHSATYRKYPGLNNVAYMSDPDLPPDHGSPSPTDEVFDSAPAPPPYMPPQPSIEEARQQMHSLLDDAFALVSPSSQGSRFTELGMSPTSVQGLLQRQGLSSAGFVSSGEQLQEAVYSSRGQYDEPPSSNRPRPVGGSTGAQLHHLTQVGVSSQMGAYPAVGRSLSGPTGSSWNQRHSDQDLTRPGASRESGLSFHDFSSSSLFQMSGPSLREPSAPPLLLTSATPEYPPEDAAPSAHTSASLIKAIREELRRLAQKQAAVSSYQ